VAGSSLADGARVVQTTADGRASRQWQLRPQTDGVFLVVNRNSGKVLDVSGGSTADGVALIQYRDIGGSNQRWTFHRVNGWGTATRAGAMPSPGQRRPHPAYTARIRLPIARPTRPTERMRRATRLWLTTSPPSRSSAVILGTP
jgi:hypothetical protein